MTIFSTLSADARKALARKELRRRGISRRPVDNRRLWLPYISLADLERLENVLISEEPIVSIEAMTPKSRGELADIVGATLRAIDTAGVPNEPARREVDQLLRELASANAG